MSLHATLLPPLEGSSPTHTQNNPDDMSMYDSPSRNAMMQPTIKPFMVPNIIPNTNRDIWIDEANRFKIVPTSNMVVNSARNMLSGL